jgi:hypothetical protein
MRGMKGDYTTRAQRESVLRKFNQNPDGAKTYREFRARAKWSFGVLMLPWCNMWLGIERDGHTHS